MGRTPYPGLTPAQVEVARALVASPRWTGIPHLCALRPDGSLVQLTAHSRAWPAEGVPYLPDAVVLGHVLELLQRACGAEVGLAFGTLPSGRRYCTLRAGDRVRTWEGDLLAEAVGAALVARWAALDRRSARRG